MKVPMKTCQLCGADTELMYKAYDTAQQAHDVPICVECAANLLTQLVNRFPKRRDDSKDQEYEKQRFHDVFGEDEAIAFFTEFADIKIQNIGVQGRVQHDSVHGCWYPRRLVAVIVRSVYNNQWRMQVIDGNIPLSEVMEEAGRILKEIFADNKYPEDMV